MTQEQIKTLSKYFPQASLDAVAGWLPKYGVLLSITKPRLTRHGDYSLAPVRGMQRISVNGSLSKYAFLLTFTHELAHLITHKKYGLTSRPHGQQWKEAFIGLMRELPLGLIYPEDILKPLMQYMKNPKASQDRHTALALALAKYDPQKQAMLAADHFEVQSLEQGAKFEYKNSIFKVIEKRRRLFTCQNTETLRLYNFQPQTLVKAAE